MLTLIPYTRTHAQYFHTHLKLDPTDLTYGTSLHGSTRLFDALAKHYNSNAFSPVHHVLPSQILTGPGCGSLLDQIFEHLADPGDACLLAAPYYNGFDADLATRVGVRCVPVYSKHGDGTESERFKGDGALDGFEQALLECSSPVRAIIVCNPNNPVGKCYDRSALLAYGQFAQKHNLHLVFDEIYALSTFPTSDDDNPQPFISALNIDWSTEANCDPSRIHILSSASKDFGLNGFRIGTFVSQFNPDLINAMKVTGKLYMVSSPADALFSALLNDENFYSSFVSTNRTRLTEAYEHIKAWCVRHGIPYKPSNAGHFLLVDLSAYCHDGESQLWSKALDKCKVCITPAASNYHFPQKGWFRITFSMPNEVLNLGLRRLESALGIDVQPRLSPGSLRVYSALCGTRSKRVREEDGSPSAIKEAKRLVGHADVSGAGAQEQNVVNVGNKVGCLG